MADGALFRTGKGARCPDEPGEEDGAVDVEPEEDHVGLLREEAAEEEDDPGPAVEEDNAPCQLRLIQQWRPRGPRL